MTSTIKAFNNFTFSKTSNMTIYKNNQRVTFEQFKFLKTLSNVTFEIAPNIHESLIITEDEIDFTRYFSDFRTCAISVKIPLNSFDIKTKSAKYQEGHFNFTDLTFFTNSNTSDQKLYACQEFHLFKPVSYTHLTLPTIYSV